MLIIDYMKNLNKIIFKYNIKISSSINILVKNEYHVISYKDLLQNFTSIFYCVKSSRVLWETEKTYLENHLSALQIFLVESTEWTRLLANSRVDSDKRLKLLKLLSFRDSQENKWSRLRRCEKFACKTWIYSRKIIFMPVFIILFLLLFFLSSFYSFVLVLIYRINHAYNIITFFLKFVSSMMIQCVSV